MAQPQIVATNTWVAGASVGTYYLAVPAGVKAGDLIVGAWFRRNNSGTGTLDAAFTSLGELGANGDQALRTFYRIADGSEGGTNMACVTLTAATARGGTICYVIRNWSTKRLPASGGCASGASSANPNPPSLTPSWGAADALWIVAATMESSTPTLSSLPSGYGSSISITDGSGQMATGIKVARVTSDDPGTYTYSSAADWIADTVAVAGQVPRHGFVHHNNPAIA